MIAADAHTSLKRVRDKLEETFGQFELRETPEPATPDAEEELIATLSRAIEQRRLVEIEYLKPDAETTTRRVVEPYWFERRLPFWYVHTWDRTRDASRSFRFDRMRSATLLDEEFDPRPGFTLESEKRTARVWFAAGEAARRRIEQGAEPLVGGAAIAELPFGSLDWLVADVLRERGYAVVLEPEELRAPVAARARELLAELSRAGARR
jgi:proteasome accessory factor C